MNQSDKQNTKHLSSFKAFKEYYFASVDRQRNTPKLDYWGAIKSLIMPVHSGADSVTRAYHRQDDLWELSELDNKFSLTKETKKWVIYIEFMDSLERVHIAMKAILESLKKTEKIIPSEIDNIRSSMDNILESRLKLANQWGYNRNWIESVRDLIPDEFSDKEFNMIINNAEDWAKINIVVKNFYDAINPQSSKFDAMARICNTDWIDEVFEDNSETNSALNNDKSNSDQSDQQNEGITEFQTSKKPGRNPKYPKSYLKGVLERWETGKWSTAKAFVEDEDNKEFKFGKYNRTNDPNDTIVKVFGRIKAAAKRRKKRNGGQ